MADQINIFVYTLFFGIFLIVPLFAIIFLRKRLPLPMWKKHKLMVYALPDGVAFSPDMDFMAAGAKVVKELTFWKLTEKGVPKYWVRTRLIFGYWMDYAFKPCIRNMAGEPTLRVIEKVKDLNESNNLFPMDLPEEIDLASYKADLSSSTEEVNTTTEREIERGKDEDLLRNVIVPIAGMFFAFLFVFFAYMHSENVAKIYAQSYTASAGALQTSIDRAYNISVNATNKTGTPQAPQVIPFTIPSGGK